MPTDPWKDPNCAMCRWWVPRDGAKRNFSSRGTCTALTACLQTENDTVGHQSCALFGRVPARPTNSEEANE